MADNDEWTVRDPEPGEAEELAKQSGGWPEHEPGDEEWNLGLEEDTNG